MGIAKSEIGTEDVFVRYDHEDVMFRWDAAGQKFYRKFVGDEQETEMPYDNDLLNDALRFGDQIASDDYQGAG